MHLYNINDRRLEAKQDRVSEATKHIARTRIKRMSAQRLSDPRESL